MALWLFGLFVLNDITGYVVHLWQRTARLASINEGLKLFFCIQVTFFYKERTQSGHPLKERRGRDLPQEPSVACPPLLGRQSKFYTNWEMSVCPEGEVLQRWFWALGSGVLSAV